METISLRHRFSVYRSKSAIGACKHVKLFSFVRLQLHMKIFIDDLYPLCYPVGEKKTLKKSAMELM